MSCFDGGVSLICHRREAVPDIVLSKRWALTGTPIFNSVEELFPYFKFLRVKHTGSFNSKSLVVGTID